MSDGELHAGTGWRVTAGCVLGIARLVVFLSVACSIGLVAVDKARAQGASPTASNPDPPVAATPSHALAKAFWAKRLSGFLATRDGTRLAYTVLLPEGSGPFPVILNYSGYDPSASGGPAYMRGDSAMSIALDRELIEAGYAVAGVNARGSGCSEGSFDFSDTQFGSDGSDAVEFLARQAWSNGKVGMHQFSWAGLSQVLTAAERPPHLLAIAPGMVAGDSRDTGAPGGVPEPFMRIGWWGFVATRWNAVAEDARARADTECLSRLAVNASNASKVSPTTISFMHPLRDEYTERRNAALRAGNINIPVLSVTAFQDQVVTSRNGHFLDLLDPSRLWVIATNGPHDMYHAARIRAKIVRFFDHFIKAKANGFDREPHTEFWYEASSPSRGFEVGDEAVPGYVLTFPKFPPTLQSKRLFLGAGGTLAEADAPSGEPDPYQYPAPAPTVNAEIGADRWGPLSSDYRKGSLAYTGPVLATSIVTAGAASANLWVSSTAPDADLQVTLTEVLPDGQEIYVQRGWLRMSNRALDAGKSTELQPHLHDRPETIVALVPGEPALGHLELPNFSHAFRKGSRLRIWIDTPSATGFLAFSPFAMPAINKIWHDPERKSYLALGVLPGVFAPAQAFKCGAVLKQPCRDDPLRSEQ